MKLKSQNNIDLPAKIAVMFGGLYAEHDISIFSFKNFYADVQKNDPPSDIILSNIYYLSRDGRVFISPVEPSQPAAFYFDNENKPSCDLLGAFTQIKDHNEFVYLICDSTIGFDGRFTGIAGSLQIRGTFGSSLSFSLCRSKFHLNQFIAHTYPKIKIPDTVNITHIDELDNALDHFDHKDIIVKPNSLGSSILTGMFQCYSTNRGSIKNLVEKIFEYDNRVLIQEYIIGQEFGCYCMENKGFVDILGIKQFPKQGPLLSTKEKYEDHLPSHDLFLKKDIPEISDFSKKLFKDLDCANLSRMDFIVSDNKDVYFLENNCNPALRGFIEAYKNKYTSCTVWDMLKVFIENENHRTAAKTDYHLNLGEHENHHLRQTRS